MEYDQGSNAADLEALSRVLRGDREAYRLIVEKYRPVVLRLSRSYMKDEEEAEDAAQEIFLRAFRSLNRFKLDKSFLNWLYTIALNHLKSRYGKIRRLSETRAPMPADPPSAGRTPEEEHLHRETRRDIRRAVQALPSNLRDITVLYYLEELPVGAISEITGLGGENVKSRLHRARKKLREILEKTQPPEDYGGIM